VPAAFARANGPLGSLALIAGRPIMSMAAATRDGQVRGPDGAFADSPQMRGFNDDVVSAQSSCHLGSLNAWAAVTEHRVWHLGIEFGVVVHRVPGACRKSPAGACPPTTNPDSAN